MYCISGTVRSSGSRESCQLGGVVLTFHVLFDLIPLYYYTEVIFLSRL